MMYQMNRVNRQPRIFDDPFFRSMMGMEPRRPQGMRVDVREDKEAYILEAELPGVKLEDITLTAEDDVLTIVAQRKGSHPEREGMVMRERRFGRVERRFSLEGIDQNGITAACADGVLTVTLPKEKPEGAKALRHIPIAVPAAAPIPVLAEAEPAETEA